MTESQSTVRNVAWSELFPWLILFRSVRIALMARVLVLGAIGLIATTLGWKAIGGIWSNTDDKVIQEWRADTNEWLWEDEPTGLSIDTSAQRSREVFDSAKRDLFTAPLEAWLYMTRPFQDLFDARLSVSGFVCLFLACLWELLVWGIIGGAISRIAALKFTRDEALGPVAAVQQSLFKLPSYSLAPLIALAGAAVFAVQLLVLGLLMNVDFLAMLASFVWPFVLVLGLLMAILLMGALVGWPLMWATVSVEGTDAFDALSRSYAYVYQRPWRLLWYVAFSVFLAAVSMFVVKGFATSAIALGRWSISWGLDSQTRQHLGFPVERTTTMPLPAPALPEIEGPVLSPAIPPLDNAAMVEPSDTGPSMPLRAARSCINFWQSLWKAIAAGYQAAFVWVAAVGIYLLLRRDIDGAEMDEVFVDQEAEYGMPPLEADAATGVPEVATNRAAQPGDTGAAG